MFKIHKYEYKSAAILNFILQVNFSIMIYPLFYYKELD